MRALLDTNVLARAIYSVGGPAEECVLKLSAPPHVLIVSSFLLGELRRVLRYPRLQRVHGLDEEGMDRAMAALGSLAAHVEPKAEDIIRVVPDDPDDDPIVAAAVAGGADVLCTWNKHLFHKDVIDYCRQNAIEVMNDIELLARLRESES